MCYRRIILSNRQINQQYQWTNTHSSQDHQACNESITQHIRNDGSWCTCCSPGGICHHLAAQFLLVFHLRQSGNLHLWKTPANEWHFSSQCAPEEKKTEKSWNVVKKNTKQNKKSVSSKHKLDHPNTILFNTIQDREICFKINRFFYSTNSHFYSTNIKCTKNCVGFFNYVSKVFW